MIRGKTGIALLNMGSPASPGDVRRFLKQLFLDIEMFHFPGERFVRPFFATLISNLRAGRVRRRYGVLGGTSPLLSLTQEQAVGLEGALLERGYSVPVEVSMRYSHPFSTEAVARLRARSSGSLCIPSSAIPRALLLCSHCGRRCKTFAPACPFGRLPTGTMIRIIMRPSGGESLHAEKGLRVRRE